MTSDPASMQEQIYVFRVIYELKYKFPLILVVNDK